MNKKIRSALISVFYKDGIDTLAHTLVSQGVKIYSTGGTQEYLEKQGIEVVAVESLTGYPSILGGRVKTLHPMVFGGVLGRREMESDQQEMKTHGIPEIDLVIVDLYPFEETVKSTDDEKLIIEKIDIGGPSMIRAAAKNFNHVAVIADKKDYASLERLLKDQDGSLTLEQRRAYAAKAFRVVAQYDLAIEQYFHPGEQLPENTGDHRKVLRYGENPHQHAEFMADTSKVFQQLNGKEISYNNLVDIDAAFRLIREFDETVFAIIKHTNVCGIAARPLVKDAWTDALAGDPESAFGGVLACNGEIDLPTAEAISEIFFEVLIAESYDAKALELLKSKKNRILLQLNPSFVPEKETYRQVLNGMLKQDTDEGNYKEWIEKGGRESTEEERKDLAFANLVCKHLKSNAIALVRNRQLIGKGCGQTSRIDALRQAVAKAGQSGFSTNGAVMASDAFFPFGDCVQMGHEAGINAFIQPGGSIRDNESIDYCKQHNLALVMTGMRHFRH